MDTVTHIVAPVAEKMGLILWDVRYEKEGSSWYLRLFIDKTGGVNIEDCENFSRAVDPLIDEADPVPGSYYLEVSSPGIERDLLRPEHFEAFLGHAVSVRLIRSQEDGRDFVGKLLRFHEGMIEIETGDGKVRSFPQKQTAYVRLYEDYESGGVGEA